jgi:hypothetical protein
MRVPAKDVTPLTTRVEKCCFAGRFFWVKTTLHLQPKKLNTDETLMTTDDN